MSLPVSATQWDHGILSQTGMRCLCIYVWSCQWINKGILLKLKSFAFLQKKKKKQNWLGPSLQGGRKNFQPLSLISWLQFLVQPCCSLTPKSVLCFSTFSNTWAKGYSLYEVVSETSRHRQSELVDLLVGWFLTVFVCVWDRILV